MTSQDRMQTDAQAQYQPNFMSAVMKIDNELHDEDVESMKFLCQGLVVGSKLKRVGTAHELVSLLQSSNNVKQNDPFLLADLLQYIGRIDVLEEIGFEEKEVIFRRRQQGSNIKPFYVLLFQIAEELPMEDVKKAAFHYGKVPRSQTISSGLDLFTVMVQRQSIRPENVGLLKTIFDSLERRDLVELIERYSATRGDSVMRDLEDNFVRTMSFRGFNYGNMFSGGRQIPPGAGLGPSLEDFDVRDAQLPAPSQASEIGHTSMNTEPPSEGRMPPSAPPESLPNSIGSHGQVPEVPERSVAPASHTPANHSHAQSKPPDGYDERIIPWSVLEILSQKIHAKYWPDITEFLGVHIDTVRWDSIKTNRQMNIVILKRWLVQTETQETDPLQTRLKLIRALNYADCKLLAEQVATLLNVNYNNVANESMSSVGSGSHLNAVSSSASAAPVTTDSMSQREIMEQVVDPAVGAARVEMALVGRLPAVNPMPYYNMSRSPRGFCIIINNRNFFRDRPHAKLMVAREGTEVDKEKLENTFRGLNFLVSSHDDMTDSQMVQLMNEIANKDHSRFDCFVCCILSHGVEGSVYGTNGMTVPVKDMTGPLRAQACPGLAGKPKLFFVQACQGREKQTGHLNDIQMDNHLEEDAPRGELIPNEADFLLGYATVPGFVSYRSKSRGSWYVTKLTEMLQKYGYDHDILDILTLVNFEVGKGDALIEGGVFKQSPAPMYSLRKKLIFSRLR
ncbi:uncharacterized protein [Littorina saxatilis]|uniref:Caspase-8 n=1 Tax=Littorina saxatilis TaxID=31220 RepID=A0AAN9BXH0_9CAEN